MAQAAIQPQSDISNPLPLMRVAGTRIRNHGLRTYNKHTTRRELMFDLSGEWEEQKQACRAETWLAAALGMLRAIDGASKYSTNSSYRCLYIMRAEGSEFCKIGVSVDPVERLASVQTCCPFPLSLYACVFAPTWKAGQVEQAVLRQAMKSGISAQGEWIRAKPDEALSLVFAVAWAECLPICDAETWFKNMRDSTMRVHRFQNRKRFNPT